MFGGGVQLHEIVVHRCSGIRKANVGHLVNPAPDYLHVIYFLNEVYQKKCEFYVKMNVHWRRIPT